MDDLFGDDVWGEEPDWAKDSPDKEAAGDDDSSDTDVPVMLGAQHVMLLVDCHADMFCVADGKQRPVDLAMTLAQQLLQQRIRDTVTLKIGKRNGVGVLLYDTKPLYKGEKQPEAMQNDENEDSEDDNDRQEDLPTTQVHLLVGLNPPGIAEARVVRDCLETRHLQQEFANTLQEAPLKAPLQDAIEEAVRIFREAKCVREKASKPGEPTDTKSIWIFTNRDAPYSSPSTLQLLQNVARDAQDSSGIQILVWPLPHPADQAEFSMEHLFGNVVSKDVFGGRRLTCTEELEDGLEDLQQYWKKTRRLYWGPLILPGVQSQNGDEEQETPNIMVDWYRFVQFAKKPGKVQIDLETKRETIKLRQMLDNNHEIFVNFKSGDVEDRKTPKGGMNRIRQFANLGGENILMSTKDLDEIRLMANGGKTKPALSLFGFQPRDSIPWYHTMNPAYLIYPNDTLVKGSRDAFVELHAAMLRKQVVAIGEVLHRVHWSSRLVAIYPLEEDHPAHEHDSETKARSPPGMMVVTLPFEDDIRCLEEDEAWEAWIQQQQSSTSVKEEVPDEISSEDLKKACRPMPSEELVKAAINLISRQRLEGVELGEDFENAGLTEFFNYLEAVALEIPVPDEKVDYDTRPDDDMILEVVKDQIEEFRRSLPDDVEIPKASGGGAGKRKRDLPPDDSGLDWNDLYLSNELDQVKVPQLKSYLRSVGAPLSGNKGMLLERVAQWIQKSSSSPGKAVVKMETN